MTKKRIIAIVISLAVLVGLGFGIKNSLGQKKSTVSGTGEIAQLSSSKKEENSSQASSESKKESQAKKESEKKQESVESKKESTKKIAEKKEAQKEESEQKSTGKSSNTQGQTSKATSGSNSSNTTTKQRGQSTPSKAKQNSSSNKQNQASKTPTAPVKPASESVKVTIVGTNSNSREYLVNRQSVTMKSGETAFSALQQTAAVNGFRVSYSGSGGSVYVKGINNLFEFSKGSQSGWLYRVNGVFQKTSASSFSLQNGDVVEWLYTENLGADLGAPQG